MAKWIPKEPLYKGSKIPETAITPWQLQKGAPSTPMLIPMYLKKIAPI